LATPTRDKSGPTRWSLVWLFAASSSDDTLQFCKRTEWATLLARERDPNYRETSPQCGGWQAMKPARELLKSGRVSEAKYQPPLLSGYVREGAHS
jgi:hypothetical protein